MAFNRFTSIGSSSARVTVDLSQVEASVQQMRSLAQQITQSVQQIQQSQSKISGSGGSSASSSRTTESEQRLRVERQITDEARKQFQIAQSTVGQIRAAVAEQANLFRTATATAPSTVSRGGTEQQLRAARQPIVELQRELARLRTAYLQATSPEARNALIPEFQRIAIEARNAANSIQPLRNAVSGFVQEVQASRSGVTGYFNAVRENIEKINEQSLAANLQEISFRLLPLGAAAAALTARGVQTAQSIEEATISFNAFTGSAERTQQIMEELRQQSARFGQPFIETVSTMQRFAPLIRQAGLELDDVFNLAVRLSTLNPAQGIEGALFAINEALAGQWRSLQTRFNIPTTQLREMIDQRGFVGGLDRFLNQLGRTTQFAEQFGQTSRASFTRLQDSIDNFLASSMENFLGTMGQAADGATDFFNRLSEGPAIIQQLTGGILTFTSTLTTALITLGQFALAITSIHAVIEPLNLNIGSMARGLGRIAAGATAVGGGVLAGTAIAGTTGIGGVSNQQEASERLIQILTAPIAGLVAGIQLIVTVIQNAGNLIGAAFQNLIITLEGIGGFFQDVISNIGAVIQNAIGGIEIAIGNAMQGIARFLTNIGIDSGGLGLSGANLTGQGLERQLAVAGQLGGITSIWDRISGRLIDLTQMALLPTDAQMDQIRGDMERLWLDLYNAAASVFGLTTIPLPGTGVPTDGGLTLGGGGMGITPEQLEEIRDLWSQIQQQQREFALQEQRIMQDRVIAAQREAEDFALSQSRALENFNLQQIRAVEDYNRSRAQSIEDFERQIMETEAQTREQRQKQQEDFNKQMLRAQEDHIRDMVRMARDVDRAISARNFLAAQDQLERMRDAEEDFSIEQQRRREDFAQQIADLEENLQKQQDKRREDFERQLARQEENFNLQRQRQVADFERQRQLEEQDRQRRLQRQAQDYALQDQRRQEDFNRRIQDMIIHNDVIGQLWNTGLSNLENRLAAFASAIGGIAIGGTGGSGGTAGTGGTPGGPQVGQTQTMADGSVWVWNGSGWQRAYASPGGTAPGGIGGSGTIGGGGFTPVRFAVGTWNVPRTTSAIVDQGEIITPEPFASAVRRGEAVIGGRNMGGDTYQVTVPLQVINAQNMNEDQLAEKVAGKINQKLEEKRREIQPRRGS